MDDKDKNSSIDLLGMDILRSTGRNDDLNKVIEQHKEEIWFPLYTDAYSAIGKGDLLLKMISKILQLKN